jgi:rare lipoprotein A
MTRARFNLMLVCLFVSACGKKKVKTARVPSTPSKPPVPAAIGSTETGMASWYGHPYHGRQAADGEIYDMETLVAAHRTLPFNTWVRVTNLSNSKTVDVRIIDRGPFVGGRIIDLSHAAAQAVDLIGPGVAQVRLEIIRAPRNPEQPVFGVQVGLFAFRQNADRMMQNMQTRYGTAQVIAREGLSTTWRVVVGRENSADNAESLAARIRGEEKLPESFVVRLDRPLNQ